MAENSDLRQAINAMLSELPANVREAFVMKAIEGRSLAEMSILLEAPPKTLRRRFLRATKLLREVLEGQGWTQGEASSDPDPGSAAVELAAKAVATDRADVVLSGAELRLTPSLVVCDPRILQFLDQHPEKLRELDPRDFENLVAGMLERFGYQVQVGPAGADGGVDVHASKESPTGLEYLLVQCKRYAETRKVSVPIIKQMWADVLHRRATRGLVVTTSWFTRDALKYVSMHQYQLGAADFDRVREWLKVLAKRTA